MRFADLKHRGTEETQNMKPLHALFVEDSPDDAELLARELHSSNYAVTYERVETADALRAALQREPWDLVLCDFTLPRFSGTKALSIVRETGLDLPFIYVSGTIGEEIAVEAMKSGAHDYIMKDNLTRLAPAIERELREVQVRKQRQFAEDCMRTSEHKYRRLFESLADAAFLIAAQTGRIVDANTQAEKLLQRNRGEIMGTNHSTLYPAADPSLVPDFRPASLESCIEMETEVVNRAGQRIPVHVRASALELYGQRLVLAIMQDITERLAVEHQLRHAQKMEGISHLAGGVAHDFNNLLTIIRGGAELAMISANRNSPEVSECLRQVIGATERAANLTRQLLTFDRKQHVQFQTLDLHEVTTNLIKMLKRIIGETVEIRCNFDPQPAFIRGDVGMIEQVLVNLAVNARDAMPRGGELIFETKRQTFDENYSRTHIGARAGEFIVLSVSDRGTGISPENLPHIFEPFFTTKPPGHGTGLGLATVYGIVKQHQGWIEVSSQPGEGTTFKIMLPETLPITAPMTATGTTIPTRTGTEIILLVEDESAVRMGMRRILETSGYKIMEAASAAEALELWRTNIAKADLLLTDVVLPDGITGYELAEELRSYRPTLKTVFVSGYSAEISGGQPKRYFVQKPFPSQALLETIRCCLDEK